MKYKRSIIVLALVIFLLSIAGAWASDTNDTMIASEDDLAIELSCEDNGDIMTVDGDEDALNADEQTFGDLNNTINGNNDLNIYLQHDYAYSDEDSSFNEGIVIDRDVYVYGNGHTINGSTQARIFKITSGNVVFHDIIFANGKTTELGGAAYFGNGATGTLINCNFTGNTADDGGAVYFVEGSVGETIDCKFTDNTATSSGGALVFLGNGTVTGCNFTDNNAMSGSGGAVYFSEGTVTGCNFTDNSATYGGAVYFRINGTVSESCFTDNSATYGGAVYFDGGSYGETVNCIFTGNSASHCGAIYSREALNVVADACIFKSSSDTTDTARILPPILTVDNFTTLYNSGRKVVFDLKTNSGMHINGNISISIYTSNGEWIGNYSCLSDDGWIVELPVGEYYAIYNTEYYGFSPVNRTIIVDVYKTFSDLNDTINGNDNPVINLFDDFYFDFVCDVDFVNGIIINRPVTINGNGITIDARRNGVIFNVAAGDVILKNIIFKNGKTTENGGAVYFKNTGTVSNCNFTGNTAYCGGAVYFENSGTVSNCNFANNSVNTCGGAVYFENTGAVSNCNFTNNIAPVDGGAIRMNSGSVENCNFTGNTVYRGAVYIENTGTVLNCNFTNNQAINENSWGGAICIYSGNVSNCNFTNNTSTNEGGAIRMNSGSVENCNFNDNKVTVDYGYGGAIYLSFGSVVNCNFNDNKVTGEDSYGGAIYMDSGTVLNCNFTDNKVTGDYSSGGAIYMYSGTVSNCNFINNHITDSGVIFIDSGNVLNCNFTGNTADDGGAIFIDSGNVLNCNFINNTATDKGGAIYVYSGNVSNCNFTDNKATVDYGWGGAIYVYSGNVSNCNFTDNSAIYGGAVYFKNYGEVTNCNFTNNQATYDGGAVYFENTGTVSNCNFANNSANDCGGAVYFLSSGAVINCNFTDNSASEGGGAVFIKSTGNVTNCNFTGNNADYGGAIYIYSGTVSNCNFIDNKVTGEDSYGGAIYMDSGTVLNCNFTGNKADYGGAVYFLRTGTVLNCNFTNNPASICGGAIYFYSSSNVINCNFTNNSARYGGAIRFNKESNVTNCNFTNNAAWSDGGAVYFDGSTGTVINCNFTNNKATGTRYGGGAVFFDSAATVRNCIFTGNNATSGSAIYFYNYNPATKTVSDSTFLNNRANAEDLDVVKNDDNITITFTGKNNLLNAIYSRNNADVTFTNVTYWGANGITTVSDTLSGSNKVAGQNITVVVVNGILELNEVNITDADGRIVLNINAGDNYYIFVRHVTDSYYTEAKKTISNNTKFNVNVTSKTTNNKTVNITAKSNIPQDIIQGKLLFILPDGTEIDANYASNGIWWTIYTFDDCAEYNVNASYVGLDNVTVNNATITINKLQTVLTGNAVTAVYNINKNLVITLTDAKGNPLSGASVTVNLNGLKTYTTDSNGQIKVSTKGMAPKAYTAKVTFNGNANYVASAKDIKVTVKKATPKMTAKKKTFKRTVKTKKYTIVLKDNTGKAMKKVKVTLKLKGKKTITAKTNSKGKATFKIKKLTKKGTYKTTVTFKGNKYYNKVVKKVKIKIK